MKDKIKKFFDLPDFWSPIFLIYDSLLFLFDVFVLKSKILFITSTTLLIYDSVYYYQWSKKEKK